MKTLEEYKKQEQEILYEYAYKFNFEDFMRNYSKPFGRILSVDVNSLIVLSPNNTNEENQTAIRDFYKKARKIHSEKIKKRKQEAVDLRVEQNVENIIHMGMQVEEKIQQKLNTKKQK